MILKEGHWYAESSLSCDLRISLLEIHTEFQGVLKSQNNPKEKQIWRTHISWFRNSLQSYSNQNSVVWCIDRHIDQWNRNNEPRYQLLHVQSNDFWQECQNNSIGERAIISINSEKTRYPHAKEWSWTFYYTVYKHYILKLDQKSQCRN